MIGRRTSILFRNKRFFHSQPKSLVETHEEFLTLVNDHGQGNVHFQKHSGHVEIILDNPSKRNAVSGKMMVQFAKIIDEILPIHPWDRSAEESSMVGVVITGAGTEAFCAGADLGLVKEVVNTPIRGGLMSAFMTDALNRLRESNLISICCLNGPALGGGAEIVTACDFRVMSNDAYVQFVHAKIGASPGWGGARRLTNIIGRTNALLLCAASVKVNAQESQFIRLIDGIYNPYTEENTEIAKTPVEYNCLQGVMYLQPFLQQKFPGSVRAIKLAIAGTEYLDTKSSMELEAEIFRQRWAGNDNKSALGGSSNSSSTTSGTGSSK